MGVIPTIFRFKLVTAVRTIFPGQFSATRLSATMKGRTVVFCVTSGRSGSQTLRELFSCLDTVEAFHEPKPLFDIVMREVQRQQFDAGKFLRFIKLPAILRSSDRPVYVETSHLFGKGFFTSSLDLKIDLRLVFLYRNDRAISKSLLKLNTIPGRTAAGLRFYISPDDDVILKLPNWNVLTDYQLCYWHSLEIRARQRVYREICRKSGIVFSEVDIDKLNLAGEFERVLGDLNILYSSADQVSMNARRGVVFNERKGGNLGEPISNIDALENEVTAMIEINLKLLKDFSLGDDLISRDHLGN